MLFCILLFLDADSGKAVYVKRVLKVGKGPYGGANIDREPRSGKNGAPSKLPWSFCTSIGFGFSMFLLFGY
jgi:hypothetical protein